jgi:hypothetical protein
VKILPVTIFTELVLYFQQPPVILKKIVFKAAAMSVHWRKSTNEGEGKTLKEI